MGATLRRFGERVVRSKDFPDALERAAGRSTRLLAFEGRSRRSTHGRRVGEKIQLCSAVMSGTWK